MIRRDERGFTLVEVLVVMTIAMGLLGATLVTFTDAYRHNKTSNERIETAEIARTALDKQARQLRNLAKRLNNTAVIDTVGKYDFIFQTSDPSRTWVRYCLESGGSSGASPQRARLWTAELAVPTSATSSPVTSGMKSDCPGSGWTRTNVVADFVTNTRDGLDRPIFTYRCTDGSAGCTAATATFDQIISVSAQLFVDSTPTKEPPELKVVSGVYLRNQNQAPVARFTPTPVSPRVVNFNASGSSDYEGRTLLFYWFHGTMPTDIRCDAPTITTQSDFSKTMWGGRYIGDGITLSHTFANSDGPTAQIGLVACDPGDRYSFAGPTTVSIP